MLERDGGALKPSTRRWSAGRLRPTSARPPPAPERASAVQPREVPDSGEGGALLNSWVPARRCCLDWNRARLFVAI